MLNLCALDANAGNNDMRKRAVGCTVQRLSSRASLLHYVILPLVCQTSSVLWKMTVLPRP
jgi:hypothetical protein